MNILIDIAVAFQFLTRLPVPGIANAANLSRAVRFFPLVGLAVGLVAAGIHFWLSAHLPAAMAALLIVFFLMLVSGGLHEDGLADVVDAFGGGWSREQVLVILKDSRVGSFGALAIVGSVLARTLLIAALPLHRAAAYLICAQTLCRWTALPLGYSLSPARPAEGQGARLAAQISFGSLIVGTLFALAVSAYLLRSSMWMSWGASLAVTVASGLYFRRRLGGITGDCFGATNQLTEIAIYLCGVWR
jgi:adenosylcobinamide-GDP ribazoletransferase